MTLSKDYLLHANYSVHMWVLFLKHEGQREKDIIKFKV